MFVKSLRMRGFKSFPDKTEFEFEPGITAIVGPNGSGKSNVVDALCWVMGSQAARQMRGGRMEDVIFSGTAARTELGRAEVELTFDNSSGEIPLDTAEVSIGRMLFRSGESKYTINRQSCRLIDVIELLGDAGIGRQMHSIVGQGQIEGIVMAQPEDRRVTIEEAAGVLKHRKRRERSLRKLEGVEADLVRLDDVDRELRRQLRPLSRQVEGAKRHGQASAEHARLALWRAGSNIREHRSKLEASVRSVHEYEVEIAELASAVEMVERDLVSLGGEVEAIGQLESRAQRLMQRLERVSARFDALCQVVSERRRGLVDRCSAIDREMSDPTLDLPSDSEVCRAKVDRLAADTARLDGEAQRQSEFESRHAVECAEADAAWHAAGLDGDDRRAALTAQISASEAVSCRADADRARIRDRLAALEAETGRLESQCGDALAGAGAVGARREPLASDVNTIGMELTQLTERIAELDDDQREATKEAASLRARSETLDAAAADGIGERKATDALVARFGDMSRISDLIEVEPGAEVAVAAALAPVLHSILLSGRSTDAAIGTIKGIDDGKAVLTVRPHIVPPADNAVAVAADIGTVSLLELIRPVPGAYSESVAEVIARHASRVHLARSVRDAAHLISEYPDLVFVTSDGDYFSDGLVKAQSPRRSTAIDPSIDAARARREAQRAEARAATLDVDIAVLRAKASDASRQERAMMAELAELDVSNRAAVEAADRLSREREQAELERGRLNDELEAANETVQRERERCSELTVRVSDLEPAATDSERVVLTDKRRELDRRGDDIRRRTISVQTERASTVAQLESARQRLDDTVEREADRTRRIEGLRSDRDRLSIELDQLDTVIRVVERARSEADRRCRLAVDDHDVYVDRLDAQSVQRNERRRRLGATQERIAALSDDRHQAEIALAKAKLRFEASEEVPGRDLGARIDAALNATLPDGVEPPDVDSKIDTLEAELRRIGPINPLAVDEFGELDARRRELESEMDDVRRAKNEIVEVVRQIDDQIAQILTDAYRDVSKYFSDLFALLFPGGEGRVILTRPDDILSTGIEIEARPSGKSAKRLSLLSGGERALSSIAFLFAVFLARPSPFYVLDEVEAALDDLNLYRFCEMISSFGRDAQLLIVTHQKRTMEIADVLYGVSLNADGTSRVIGQRVSDLATEPGRLG